MEQAAARFGGTLHHPPSGGYHSFQDYESQLLVLEQRNKKRGTTSGGNGIEPRLMVFSDWGEPPHSRKADCVATNGAFVARGSEASPQRRSLFSSGPPKSTYGP